MASGQWHGMSSCVLCHIIITLLIVSLISAYAVTLVPLHPLLHPPPSSAHPLQTQPLAAHPSFGALGVR